MNTMDTTHTTRWMRALALIGLLVALGACDSDDTNSAAGDAPDGALADANVDDGRTDEGAPDAGPAGIPLRADLCENPPDPSQMPGMLGVGGGASFGEVNPEQVQRMLAAPLEGPFYMVNLIKFRERAVYPDGRATELSGREANDLYSPVEFLSAIGARPVFVGDVSEALLGDGTQWDQVAIVEYPCPLALFAMSAHPEFQARSIHKDAGVERTTVMVTHLQPSPLPADFEPPESPFPGTADDPPFEMIHVIRYNEIAQYGPDADEPERSGRDAMALYSNGATEAAQRLGVYPTAWLDVEGVFIGDGRAWDEVRLNHMPSRAGFDALVADPTRADGQYHREASLADTYALVTYPVLSDIPNAPGEGAGQGPLPIEADGTGTLCQTDDDCPDAGATHCLSTGGTGFCTVEGCAPGACAGAYVCCGGCSEAVAGFLPFEGSACFPADQVEQITAAPAACTCE